jgi:hypothetical protein
MTISPFSDWWDDADLCANLRRLVEGTHGGLNEGDLETSIKHWRTCRACQDAYPNALRTLNAIQVELENDMRNDFVRLKHQFLSHKHGLLSDSSTNVSPHDGIIVALFKAASEIQFSLGFVDGFGGLAEFSLFPVDEDSEERDAWRASAPFLRSLDDDTQHFVFTSLLTYDLLLSSYRLVQQKTYESQSVDPLDASENQENLDGSFSRFLSESAIWTKVLVDMLERSSSSYRTEYFAKNPPEPITGATIAEEPTAEERQAIRALMQNFREMKQEVRDLGDSLKATQDHLISQFAQHQQDAGAFDPFLRSELGDDVYGQLAFNTRRALQLAEYHYQQNKEPDGYNPCVNFFCCAYEIEFNARIFEPVAAKLIESGIRDYPSPDSPNSQRRFAILVHGRVRPIAVGSAVFHLKGDKLLRQILLSLKVNADEVIAGADKFVGLRNPSAHGQLADKAYADRVRELLLGPVSILKDLIPK